MPPGEPVAGPVSRTEAVGNRTGVLAEPPATVGEPVGGDRETGLGHPGTEAGGVQGNSRPSH